MRLARVLGRIAAVAVCAAAPLALTGSAQAATYDGQDPLATGCSSSALTMESAPVYRIDGTQTGTIELRYSTSCKTVWARLVSYYSQGFATASRDQDGATYSCTSLTWSSSLNAYSCYSRMLNDYGMSSYAYGQNLGLGGWSQLARTASF